LGKTGLAARGSSQAAERGRAAAVDLGEGERMMADRKPGDPTPEDAIEDRAAQDHEQADVETGGEAQPGLYPADSVPDRAGDITPEAYPSPDVNWDTRVQPERADERESEDIEREGT
jgi:hypothetical protein